VASRTRQEAYCSAGLAIPARSPLVQMGRIMSSSREVMASRPSGPVAYWVMALKRLRRFCSRFLARWRSVVRVEAWLRLSRSLV